MAQKAGSLGLMAGGIAHDFNNLLVALLAQCSLAMMKLPPDSLARDPIGKAVKAAERAATLTRQRLHFAGGGRQEIEPFDVNGLEQENLGLLQAAIPKHVALRARLTDGLPTILGDPG